MRYVETLIVGGGMAGLGTARTFAKHDYKNFLLVTDQIGGRLLPSADGESNYGAFYVRKDYTHILNFVSLKQRLGIRTSVFVANGQRDEVFSWNNLLHAWPALRLVFILYMFGWRYRLLRKRCESMPPDQALAKDTWVEKLYRQPAKEFIRYYGLEFWANRFLNPMVKATTFLDIDGVSTATMLISLLPVVVPSWQFKFHKEKIVEGISDNIMEGVFVVAVIKDGSDWVVTSKDREVYRCKNLILALPITETKKLIGLQGPLNSGMKATVVHVSGILKEPYRGHHLVFLASDSPDQWIAEVSDGSYLFYTKNSTYTLENYFVSHEVVNERRWDPAFFLGPHIVDIDKGNGLYVVGGHNFASMEDAYISGMYAANLTLGKA